MCNMDSLGIFNRTYCRETGTTFFTWFIAGMLCFIIAFLYLLLSKPSDETLVDSGKYRKCPYCAEAVKFEAKICRYCGNELPTIITPPQNENYNIHDTDEAVESGGILLNKSENIIKAIIVFFCTVILCSIIYNII